MKKTPIGWPSARVFWREKSRHRNACGRSDKEIARARARVAAGAPRNPARPRAGRGSVGGCAKGEGGLGARRSAPGQSVSGAWSLRLGGRGLTHPGAGSEHGRRMPVLGSLEARDRHPGRPELCLSVCGCPGRPCTPPDSEPEERAHPGEAGGCSGARPQSSVCVCLRVGDEISPGGMGVWGGRRAR